jgi:hypothetical protein
MPVYPGALLTPVFHPIHSHTRFSQQKKVNSTGSIWQQTMKRKLVRILVAVLASVALFAFVFPDGSENDFPYSQSEMSKEFSVKIPTHLNQQSLVVDSQRLFASNKSKCAASSSGKTTFPTLLSFAACVLRC